MLNMEHLDLYQNLMEKVKARIRIVAQINLDKKLPDLYFSVEYACFQFRKILECIAMGNLISNKDLYQQQYSNFHKHWNAKRILDSIEGINPNYYPEAIEKSGNIWDTIFANVLGETKIQPSNREQLTKADFFNIYDECSEVIHESNPFSSKVIDYYELAKRIPKWMEKVQGLLQNHRVNILDRGYYIVEMNSSENNGRAIVIQISKV
jgi:hypothetical protein